MAVAKEGEAGGGGKQLLIADVIKYFEHGGKSHQVVSFIAYVAQPFVDNLH